MRRGLLAAAAFALAAVALAACGGGATTTVAIDKESDAAVLNEVLSRQLGAVDAYARVLHGLGGFDLASARLFRAQEQEHVDGILRSLRRVGGKPEAEPEEIDSSHLKSKTDYVEFLYEMERATIASELTAISKLTTAWPRSILASTVANQAQHLVLLRRELGAKPLASVPAAFENGTSPVP